MRTYRSRGRFLRSLSVALFALGGGAVLWPTGARAQLAGTSAAPLPDVLLLVDTSGSMERMGDGKLPSETTEGQCKIGTGAADISSSPNRWGMLLQALTGNLQPFYACEAVPREGAASADFVREYSIGGQAPYDANYFLPYHRPMTGTSDDNVCAIAPYYLPGASTGVGPNQRGDSSVPPSAFPDDALVSVRRAYLRSSNYSLPAPSALASTDRCTFDQTPDGQLDAARDYARFALMTFDNDPSERTGVTGGGTGVDFATVTLGTPPAPAVPQPPFLGQWSYLRSPSNPLFGQPSTFSGGGDYTGAVQGHPLDCPFNFFEVGARNEFAPPWEGRLVPFPDPHASLYDIQLTNEQIQKVLLASRPYGATPIDGMMDDARDYYKYRANGPKDDPYVCRRKFIILLTDGAPNLDLRPSCGPGEGDVCPYPNTAAEIARSLSNVTDENQRITTFVIGFSVNGSGTHPGDGFPEGFRGTGDAANPVGKNNCKSWYDEAGENNPQKMAEVCANLYASNAIPYGSTADACCRLNEIAYEGSYPDHTGPYFAESQADIVLSFGKIMANIIKTASTRTVPAFTPTAQFSTESFTTPKSGQFIASFIPNTQRPWSGELDRTRYVCQTVDGALVSTPAPQSATQGDFMSVNLARQSADRERFFISVKADPLSGGAIDSAATIRPFANSGTSFTLGDGIGKPDGTGTTYSGEEVSMLNDLNLPADWSKALEITDHTCRRSRAVKPGVGAGSRGTVIVPALNAADCTEAVWGFTTAFPGSIMKTGIPSDAPAYDFNTRCTGSFSATAGKCSVSGTSCTVGGTDCPTGEICVPECAALGAIYRSNPTVIGPPTGFLREEGFRTFQSARRNRGITTFAATADGILHAFKAMDDTTTQRQELWSFVPPAVLPKLASNYPSGNQILLDGSPIVRETIWERPPGDTSADHWHTTLVAGLGAGGGGYYALNVTDVDCGGATGTNVAGDCVTPGAYEKPDKDNRDHVATSGVISSAHKKGPHFLWQLTDALAATTGETGKIVRTNGAGKDMVALFGRQTGTPAIGMVQIKSGDTEKQVGIAILPGGIDGPPVKGGTCSRKSLTHPIHDNTDFTGVRSSVRQWGKTCDAPVAGRSVTIVRLDNGEIIRHFARVDETAKAIVDKTIDTPFDSPMIGVPVVYPDTVGVPIQKVFIGDADGTLWRIDLTSTNPAQWRTDLFEDLLALEGASGSQPIQVPPVLSTDDAGQLVINVATGDQESIVLSGDKNYVFSLRETRDSTNAVKAKINWYKQLHETDCEPAPTAPLSCEARVTGPMVVFDRTLYFATYTPNAPPPNACGEPGRAKLWGLHYTEPKTAGTPSSGGLARFCPAASVTPTGLCSADYVESELPPDPELQHDVIPGVALRTSLTCSSFGNTFDESGSTLGFTGITPTEYHLAFGVARPATANGTQVARPQTFRRPVPRTSTKIDAWTLVIE